MEFVLAILVGVLYGCGVYLMLRRSIVKLVIGLMMLGHAANLLIFMAGRVTRGIPPLIAQGSVVPPAGSADPLPQALILTAIVIGFGVQAFAMILIRRTSETLGTENVESMNESERL